MSSCPVGHAWHTCATAIARGASKSSAEASQPDWTRAGGAVYRWHSLPWCTGTFPGACTIGASSSQVSSEAMLPVPPIIRKTATWHLGLPCNSSFSRHVDFHSDCYQAIRTSEVTEKRRSLLCKQFQLLDTSSLRDTTSAPGQERDAVGRRGARSARPCTHWSPAES